MTSQTMTSVLKDVTAWVVAPNSAKQCTILCSGRGNARVRMAATNEVRTVPMASLQLDFEMAVAIASREVSR